MENPDLLDDLEQRLATAPKWGLNARALILQAAALGHGEEDVETAAGTGAPLLSYSQRIQGHCSSMQKTLLAV